MKQKKIIRKTIEQYDNDWPKSDAIEFMAWFHSKIADVPDEGRDSLTINIECDSGYATIEFAYTRFETDKEEAHREKEDLLRKDLMRAQELSDLARLQAKYGKS